MSFQSLSFLAFLGVTLAVTLLLGRRSRPAGQAALTLACLVFYLWGGNWQAALVLVLGGCVTLLAARALWQEDRSTSFRRGALAGAVVWHTAVLLVFKYTSFFTGGAVSIGWSPLGLSFFTFQQLWCLKEAYTGGLTRQPAADMMLYDAFFPTITSGPILKPQSFFPQLREEHFLHPSWEDAAAGIYAISIGTMKKVLLADPFGVVVNNGWGRLADLSAPAAWLVILGYTLQLYFDFSGYCDIAAGIARLLGLRLPVNFDSPYRSLSIGEFWKRWHITLTSFLRECIYFPLGGSRRGAWRTYRNILLIFLISGFWHGAGWTFLIWGLLHGLAQVVERLWGPSRDRLPRLARWALTFLFVNLAWVFFRAPDLSGAVELLHRAVAGGLAKPQDWLLDGLFSKEIGALHILLPVLDDWQNLLRLFGLFGVGLTAALWRRNTIRQMDGFRPTLWRLLALSLGFAWSVLSFTGIATFIYSNF